MNKLTEQYMLRLKMWSCLLLLPFLTFAQEPSKTAEVQNENYQFLTDKEGIGVSGFLTLDSEFSQIGNDFAAGTGVSVGLIFNRSLYFGAYGMGVIFDLPNLDYDIHIDHHDHEEYDSLYNYNFKALGHGGLLIGGVFKPGKIFHGGASLKLGYGDLAMYNYEEDLVTNDFTFIISPQLEAEINVARWFKIKAAGGYRLATDLRTDLFYDKNYINSPTGSLSLIFGWFGEKKIKQPKNKDKHNPESKPKRKLLNKDKRQISL